MKKLLFVLLPLVLIGLAGAAPSPSKAKRPKIALSTHLDKTAIWVGDTVRYTIRAIHEPEVEFVMDNLRAENLNLAPFVVRDVSVRQHPFGADKKLLEVTLSLTTYEIGKPELRIPSFALYYFVQRRGFERQAETQAETISAPATRIGLRSTLAGEPLRLRDARQVDPMGPQAWIVPVALGLAGFAFLGLQGARRMWRTVRIVRPKKKRRSRRARHRMAQEFLARIRAMGRETPDDQLRFYAEIARFLRDYLGERLDVEAKSMTPQEVETLLQSSGRNGASAQSVRLILERCDQVLYGKNGIQLAREWREEIERQLEAVVRRYA
ncbi:MAG TPA: hypothetical protein VNL14_03010 [Candidatus Acidoferrales bacterium]|nr:hypothetical protein [Candidatus Acidoferrales bacterium]